MGGLRNLERVGCLGRMCKVRDLCALVALLTTACHLGEIDCT
ncbi:MAG: hypothetical protein EWM72_02003 [Nitrospira sp.]|nr:MAG: hypothetical protein EWM72_02003 [Nitrospira sp.]